MKIKFIIKQEKDNFLTFLMLLIIFEKKEIIFENFRDRMCIYIILLPSISNM